MAVNLRPLCRSRELICVFLTTDSFPNVVILSLFKPSHIKQDVGYPCSGCQDL
ncbi:hypothetical protein QBC45DRAFT_324229 [Copromyces sp. CBS 386.78]|nr:hypothetical protein QBC45DRAFT_324229 [Copromyces sp. CBS 386.78]